MTELTHLFDLFLAWLGTQSAPVLYLILFLFAVLENLFPPVPGDTVTVFGAFLVGTGKLSFALVYAATTIGSTAGFFILFMTSRALGIRYFTRRRPKWISRDHLDRAKTVIGRFGLFVILVNRFLPGVRSVISITAGILKMPPAAVLPLALASAAVWNFIWISAGSAFGRSWPETKNAIESFFGRYEFAAWILLGLIAVSVFILAVTKRKKPR